MLCATFLTFKLTQLGAAWHVGLLDARVWLPWAGATVVSLGAFRLGLGAQAGEDRLGQVVAEAGFTRFRRAAATPLNLILEVRP